MTNFEFANIYFLWLLLIPPLLIVFKNLKKDKRELKLSSIKEGLSSKGDWFVRLRVLPFYLSLITFCFLVVALARPRGVALYQKINQNEGIDIIMTMDISLSMLAKDLQPDRITALKSVAKEFALNRAYDRIGLVIYAAEALARVPLSTDRNLLVEQIEKTQIGDLEHGTAIGVGLATAVNHLKDSKAKSKVVILLTDGVNNDGFVDPRLAAEIAHDKKIKVYTIGVGTNGKALFPASTNPFTGEIRYAAQEVEIDENLLQFIAKKTGGQYFRATDNTSLKKIYQEINRLEKSEIEEKKFYNYTEKYPRFVWIALVFMALSFVLSRTFFKSIM